MNKGFSHHEQLDSQAHGRTVLAWLCETRPQAGEDGWRGRIARGEVTLQGQVATAEQALTRGQRLTWNRPPWEEPEAPLHFGIVRQDAEVLIVDKPSGLPTLPGSNYQEHTLLHLVRARFPGATPLHRLGRHTSGLVVFALTEHARQSLTRAFRERSVRKIYQAVASGHLGPDEVTIDAPIGPVPYAPMGTVHASSADGKAARSHVKVLERRQGPSGPETLVEVRIETGRPHQIRIHLACIGHPLVGDPLYASGGLPNAIDATRPSAVPGDAGYTLRAVEIDFVTLARELQTLKANAPHEPPER
ncbi:MAG: RluA family pseudouridine synthase [Deltaproteobacteria bacterium]|nr:RluA family pseudouridine synthase [Deltaproteobacteria bacterium]